MQQQSSRHKYNAIHLVSMHTCLLLEAAKGAEGQGRVGDRLLAGPGCVGVCNCISELLVAILIATRSLLWGVVWRLSSKGLLLWLRLPPLRCQLLVGRGWCGMSLPIAIGGTAAGRIAAGRVAVGWLVAVASWGCRQVSPATADPLLPPTVDLLPVMVLWLWLILGNMVVLGPLRSVWHWRWGWSRGSPPWDMAAVALHLSCLGLDRAGAAC